MTVSMQHRLKSPTEKKGKVAWTQTKTRRHVTLEADRNKLANCMVLHIRRGHTKAFILGSAT